MIVFPIPRAWAKEIIWILGMLLAFILNPLIIWGSWDEQDTYHELIEGGKLTEVDSMEITRQCFDSGSCFYEAEYSYHVGNQEFVVDYEYLFDDVFESTYKNNRSGNVLYLPEEPSRSILSKNRVEGSSTLQLMLFLAMWSLCIGIFWKPRKNYKNKSTLEKIFATVRVAIMYWVLLELILLVKVSNSEHREFPDTRLILALIVLPAVIALPWAVFRNLIRAKRQNVRIQAHLHELGLEAIFLLYLGLFFMGLLFVDWKNQLLAILYFTVSAIIAGIPDGFPYLRRKEYRK